MTYEWIKPIYWRTAEDVAQGTELGYAQFNDLNRIENDIGFLAEYFEVSIGTVNTSWQPGSFYYQMDIDRIRSNLSLVREHVMAEYPAEEDWYLEVPEVVYSYSEWNQMERLIYRLYRMTSNITQTVYALGEIMIPERIGVL